MKLDTNTAITTLAGEPIKATADTILTVGAVCIEALLASHEDDKAVSGDEKLKRYRLASRISKNAVVGLSSEDVVLVKYLIARAYGPLVVGQTWELLEGERAVAPVE